MKKFFSWVLDICPFVGGIKMTLEGKRGKTYLLKQELKGFGRILHLTVGITSVVADFTAVGGAAERIGGRLLVEQFIKKAAKEAAEKAGGKAAGRAAERGLEKKVVEGAGEKATQGAAKKAGGKGFKQESLEKGKEWAKKYRESSSDEKDETRKKGIIGNTKDFIDNKAQEREGQEEGKKTLNTKLDKTRLSNIGNMRRNEGQIRSQQENDKIEKEQEEEKDQNNKKETEAAQGSQKISEIVARNGQTVVSSNRKQAVDTIQNTLSIAQRAKTRDYFENIQKELGKEVGNQEKIAEIISKNSGSDVSTARTNALDNTLHKLN